MALPNIFTKEVSADAIKRINNLSPESTPQWGKMNVSQMLAHLNVQYDMIYTDKYPRPNIFMKLILKSFVKKIVVSEQPYKHNSPTAPAFIIKEQKDFMGEKVKLITNITKTHQLGEAHFENKVSPSFGKLSKTEWNNLFQKHIDHHLTQFGV